MPLLIQPLDSDSVTSLVSLATVIWHEHYDSLIGNDQVDYMLNKFQSAKAISQQQSEGYEYFCAFDQTKSTASIAQITKLVGYFSIQKRKNNSLFISKFYLSSSVRGKGYGREMLEYIESFAIASGKKTLDLTVNKYNSAYDIYLKLGFKNIGSAQFDIGGGYIMDDYLLQKILSS